MSDYTPEDLVRLISIPGVTVEEIRLALNLPLEGFFGLLLTGPTSEEAFAEVKKAAVEAFGVSASQKLMVIPDNWTIEPLREEDRLQRVLEFQDRIGKEMRENVSGRSLDQFAPISREVWDDEYWASLTEEQRKELGWVPNAPLRKTLDEQLQHEYDITHGDGLKRVLMPDNPGRIYHRQYKAEDPMKLVERQKVEDAAWWDLVSPAPKTTAAGQLYTDAKNAMRYYDNAKKEARQDEEPDDFDKQIEWIPPQEWLGCGMADVSGRIFFWTLMFCAVAGLSLGIAAFGNYFFGWW